MCNLCVMCSDAVLRGTSDVHGSASAKGNIPLQDQHLALAILLELAVQRGTLR